MAANPSVLHRWQKTIGLLMRPRLHNTEGYGVLTTTLKTTKLVSNCHILNPVLDPKLFFQEIAMLTLVLTECLQPVSFLCMV